MEPYNEVEIVFKGIKYKGIIVRIVKEGFLVAFEYEKGIYISSPFSENEITLQLPDYLSSPKKNL